MTIYSGTVVSGALELSSGDSGLDMLVLRLSPRLDNFYEKIGVKTLGLLYPTVCRLQVPK